MFTIQLAPTRSPVFGFFAARGDRRRRLLIGLVALCGTLAGPVDPAGAAEKLTAADRRGIEQTIRRQLDAFGRDDADGAFGYASPDIRRLFGSPDNFMQMVRKNYDPVYRAGSVQFIALDSVAGRWVQVVQLVDSEGRVWRALFTMKRQPDKTWKVGGCQLVQTSALAT